MLQEKKYYIYELGGYTYEIDITEKSTTIWIYKKEYGIKMHIIGVPYKWTEKEIIYYIKSGHEENSYIYKCDIEDE